MKKTPSPKSDEIVSLAELDQKLAEMNSDDRVRLLRKENARLQRKLDEKDAGLDILRSSFEEAYREELQIDIRQPPKQAKKKYREESVLHVTDIHFGKETQTYNITVAEERIGRVYDAVAEITELRRTTANIDTLHLLLGGDMAEGEGNIFPGQVHEIDQDLMNQIVKVGPQIVASLMASLLQIFPKIKVKGVPGNHGSRRDMTSSKRNNTDSIFYEVLRLTVQTKLKPRDYARVEWDLPLDRPKGCEWWAHARVCNRWGVLLVHGDQVRGQLGFPWYGVGKKASGWADAIPLDWQYLMMGHFHTQANYDINERTVMATGSPESSNAYAAESLAASGKPKQRLCFFNESRGLLVDCPIYLSDKQPVLFAP